jgi:hypothetical protein
MLMCSECSLPPLPHIKFTRPLVSVSQHEIKCDLIILKLYGVELHEAPPYTVCSSLLLLLSYL